MIIGRNGRYYYYASVCRTCQPTNAPTHAGQSHCCPLSSSPAALPPAAPRCDGAERDTKKREREEKSFGRLQAAAAAAAVASLPPSVGDHTSIHIYIFESN
eukprot:GHVU01134194.1.p3 GENE.GHVU01134194.1~~GHVU01134194.1.p3  ORF type:complete len:101 (-),score=20.38 GHVU01134194.1:95-397(-)